MGCRLRRSHNGDVACPSPSDLIQQSASRDLQRICQPFDNGNRGIAGAALDVADICTMDAGPVSELFLTPAAFMPQATQICS